MKDFLVTARDGARLRRLQQRFLMLGGNCVKRAVADTTTSLAITFDTPEYDTDYGVVATPSWGTTVWVSNLATTGFTLNFGTAASGASCTVSAALFREI